MSGGIESVLGFVAAAFAGAVAAWLYPTQAAEYYSLVWPPSPKSAPVLVAISVLFVLYVWHCFFRSGQSAESKNVRKEKRRLILAQMTQAIKWNDDTPEPDEEEESKKDEEAEKKDDEGKKKKKRPPTTKDLFEMLYDDVEERHVTEYDIDPKSDPYLGVFALFQERVPIDVEEAAKYTELARSSLDKGEDDSFDKEELLRIGEFRDGTKLNELLDLYKDKICKHFGKDLVPPDVLRAAKACRDKTNLDQRKGVRLLVPMLTPLMPIYLVSMLLMIFDSVTGAALWHSLSSVLDGVDAGTMSMEELKYVTIRNQIKFVFCIFAHLSSWAFTGKVTSQFRLKVRSEVMRCMLRQDTFFFDVFPSGVLQERLNNDAEMLSSKLFEIPLRIVHNICMLSSNIFAVWMLKPELVPMIFLPLPFMSLAQYFIMRFMDKLNDRQRKITENAAAGTQEVLKEIRTVREFAMEMEEADKFQANSSYRAGIEELGRGLENIVFISPLICTMNAVRNTVTYLCGFYVVSRALTVGQACQIAWAADHLQHCIREIMFLTPDIVKVLNPMGRVCDMLTSKPRIEPLPGAPPKYKPEKFTGAIEFINVDFAYPASPNHRMLHQLSFKINSGEQVAFCGTTGCGKSTSIKLIERFYEQQGGQILLDGRDIADYDVHYLRQKMSVVAQDNIVFGTTLRENILYGVPKERREGISDAEVEEVCRKANAWEFIGELPRKLETYAGERGVRLSGGQKQRIAIARAIIRNPTILVLDEATSALDSKSEVVVQKAIDKIIAENRGGCSIIIAHRLSTIKNADTINVMDHGSIKESGSHDELLKIPIKKDADGSMITGWYHDLWETQMGKSQDSDRLTFLEQRVKQLETENFELRVAAIKKEATPQKQRLGIMRRHNAPPPPPMLERAASALESDPPPAPLGIKSRVQTTY